MTAPEVAPTRLGHLKDAILDRLADRVNVAQFLSFGPGIPPQQRYARIRGHPPNRPWPLEEGIQALLASSADDMVNVRSFRPEQPRGGEFIYGLRRVQEVGAAVRRLARDGVHTIVNETIDVMDGGISGVAFAGILEFAPNDTPRCVEKPGVASLPRALAVRMLEMVYGVEPALPFDDATRVEFSLHPLRRGWRQEHTIVWETELVGNTRDVAMALRWPNRFSRHLGDKAYGLLVADLLELPVPFTMVVGRNVSPFCFGRSTGSAERWIRTCPSEQVPGEFTTHRGWLDPFALLQREDPTEESIVAVLAQAGVDARYSGGLLTREDGRIHVEGVAGTGQGFMLAAQAPQPLPATIVEEVTGLAEMAASRLGPVRMEWAHDGHRPWVLQLHLGASASSGRTIVPGEAGRFLPFHVADGIERLRSLIEKARGAGAGILVLGEVGLTSHVGDLLRRAAIPSRIVPEPGSARGVEPTPSPDPS